MRTNLLILYGSNQVYSSDVPDAVTINNVSDPCFSFEELTTIEAMYQQCQKSVNDGALHEILPTLSPSLLIKLRQAGNSANASVQAVSNSINRLLEQHLEVAKTTLLELLNAGEIRKLDSLIGKASREGRLDAAFFNVLTLNLKEALKDVSSSINNDQEKMEDENYSGTAAASRSTRHQILTHIYTRCQEEAEKNLAPANALLNKILRTKEATIRKNLYVHYLTNHQPNTIVASDGSVVNLGVKPVLVPLKEFSRAMGDAVKQIRNVEAAGGLDKESAAMMVESCRQVAKEARIVIGESYGITSPELSQWEEALEPVFRPKSPESPYIKGETYM